MSKSSSTIENGVAMVEFAVILPLILIIFLGVAELGRALLFQHRLTTAVESGARYAARASGGVDESDCTTIAAVWTGVEDATKQLVTFGALAGGTDEIVPGLNEDDVVVSVEERSATGVPDPICIVSVVVSVQYQGIFGAQLIPILDIEQPMLGATSEERYVGK